MAIYFTQNTNNVEDIEQMNNVIGKVNKVNTEATSNIGQLTDLNSKATELSNNINQALPLNSELVKNTEEAKAANTNLAATNQEATSKNTELQASLEKTKEFINGLDGSQNIPQLRLDVTELQNGLKSNQALSYEGSSISADNTLEGRTEGMRIKGRTLQNLWDIETTDGFYMADLDNGYYVENSKNFACLPNTKYTVIYNEKIPTDNYASVLYKDVNGIHINEGANCRNGQMVTFTTPSNCYYLYTRGFRNAKPHTVTNNGFNFIIIKGELKESVNYFEGIKSFGQQEDKISILSNGKNLFDYSKLTDGEILTFNNKKCFKFTDNSTNFTFNVNGEVNKQYTISIKMYREPSQVEKMLNIKFIYSDGTVKFYNLDSGNLVSYTSEVGKTLSKITGAFNHSLNCYIDLECTQLEEGTKSTSFEPYQSDKKDILIKEPLREDDYLYEDNGQVKIDRESGQYTFIGDERITKENTLINIIRFYIDTQCKNKVNTRNIICNNFNSNGTWWDRDEIGMYWDTSIQGRLWFHIPKTKFNDVESFRNFLKANPTTIVYQLATPVTEVVENCVDIDLDTYQEKTYFNILNSLPGTLDFKVPSNIASIVQNTAREVNNIWDVINNLLVPSLIDINKNVAMATIKNNLK